MSFTKQAVLTFSRRYCNVYSSPIYNSTIVTNLFKSVTVIPVKQFSALRNIQEQQNGLEKLHFEFEHVTDVSNVTDLYKNEKDLRNFMALFPSFVDDILKIKRYFPHPIMEDRMKKLLNYTVPDGKKLRATAFFAWRRSLEKSPSNHNELLLMYIMGWCLELYQAFLIVMDDMLDKSNERRGRPSWHVYQTKEGYPQHLAMNDCSLLNDLIYLVLQNYFYDKDYYLPVAELFHYISIRNINAQTMDVVISCMNRKTDKFSAFSFDKYQQIAMNKTSYQAFICPFETAALMSGAYSADLIEKSRDVLLQMGIYYQVQNDYNDCFGDSNVTGRIGDDIESGKCTWLILTALEQANSEQKKQLEKYYATSSEDAFKVKEIYTELGIPSLYAKYENEMYKSIVDQIYNLPAIFPVEMFKCIFESVRKIYDK